ncbi:MAG: uracil-DNA glycosylase [Planctomycetes bacterium]|nr:uracil-DNA glycosylase [Planctomycetota bacterium]
MVIRHPEIDLKTRSEPLLGAATYAEFQRALAASRCKRCGLAAGRTHIVVDRGNPQARAVAIGEGPGAEEDRQGRVFVGRAGRLLDDMCEEAGLDPERDLLLVNLVKCRPPRNRIPKAEEVRACSPYLWRQVELVRPRLLVLLGASAAKHLLPPELLSRGFSKLVGKFFERPELPGVQIFPLFHPAFILRNPKMRRAMVKHLTSLRDRIRAVTRAEIPLN